MTMTNTWILAADGNSARLLKGVNLVKDTGSLPEQEVFEIETKQAKDIMSDKPGRSHSSVGPGRSAMEYSSDPVQVEQERFVADLAAKLDAYAADGAFDGLVVCAAPQTLGTLRTVMGAKVREKTVAEIDRNYTNLPTEQLISSVRSVVFH